MGLKLLWTGLTILNAGLLIRISEAGIVGSILMVIGLVLLWLDK